jgi:hypothetical protein
MDLLFHIIERIITQWIFGQLFSHGWLTVMVLGGLAVLGVLYFTS